MYDAPMIRASVLPCHDRLGADLTACDRSATHERPIAQIVANNSNALLISEIVLTVRDESMRNFKLSESLLQTQNSKITHALAKLQIFLSSCCGSTTTSQLQNDTREKMKDISQFRLAHFGWDTNYLGQRSRHVE